MSICSHALYLHLVNDLHPWLPTSPHLYCPQAVQEMEIPIGASKKTFASVALLKSILKKNVDNVSRADTDAAAIDTFMKMNEHCRTYRFKMWELSEVEIQVFSEANSLMDTWVSTALDLDDTDAWLAHCDFGPGASVLATGTSFYSKIGGGELSATDRSLYSYYIRSIRCSPSWLAAESSRRATYGNVKIVRGSKLAVAPKNAKTGRVVCTEALLNMFVQQGLAYKMTEMLKVTIGIDLKTQQFKNKQLACAGSAGSPIGTIDLTSSSDTVSMAYCESNLPSKLMVWLDFVRSKETCLPNGEHVPLHMISSMGNATTFPLQTMIFSALLLGTYKVLGIEPIYPRGTSLGNFGVFGDDIIIDLKAYDLMMRVLRSAGFLPNPEKSFGIGLFRESCGGDYYDGHPVRGVYSKTLKTRHDRYSLINRLNVWSANQDIPLPATIAYLRSTVKFLPVPPWESDIAGIKVPEVLATTTLTDRNGSRLYKRLSVIPNNVSFEDLELLRRKRLREKQKSKVVRLQKLKMFYSPDAIMITAIKGAARGGSIVLRQYIIRTHYTYGISPGWDYVDMDHAHFTRDGWARWKRLTIANLGES